MNDKEIWAPLEYPLIVKGYMISSHGRIKSSMDDSVKPYSPSYHSTNGYDFGYFVSDDATVKLYPIDNIVASTFLIPPPELHGKSVKVNHIDGNTRNNNVENLEWIEDVEKWVDAKCPIHRKDGTVINLKPNAYKVSNHGRVYSNITNIFMTSYNDNGYLKLDMSYVDSNGEYYGSARVKLHRLLAISFNLPNHTPERDIINHIDGNRSNCNLKNLEWCTCGENVQHAYDTMLGINPAGEEHPRAKFTNTQRDCFYEIIKTFKDIQPVRIMELIQRRLPRITRDDVKYAKGLIRKTGFIFPDLSNTFHDHQQFSEEEWDELCRRVDEIFDKYEIHEPQEYMTDYEIDRIKKRNLEGEDYNGETI